MVFVVFVWYLYGICGICMVFGGICVVFVWYLLYLYGICMVFVNYIAPSAKWCSDAEMMFGWTQQQEEQDIDLYEGLDFLIN